MKAVYVKPQLRVENFSLTDSVAKSCGWNWQDSTTIGNPTHGDPSSCGWKYNETDIVFTNTSNCTLVVPTGDDLDGMCYNNPDGGVQIFAS